jgi:hypothetical protein
VVTISENPSRNRIEEGTSPEREICSCRRLFSRLVIDRLELSQAYVLHRSVHRGVSFKLKMNWRSSCRCAANLTEGRSQDPQDLDIPDKMVTTVSSHLEHWNSDGIRRMSRVPGKRHVAMLEGIMSRCEKVEQMTWQPGHSFPVPHNPPF